MDSADTSVGEQVQSPDMDEAARLSAALPSNQRDVIDRLVVPGACVPDVAKAVGVHRGTVNRWINDDPKFIAALNARVLEMVKLKQVQILALVPKALAVISDAIDQGDARMALQLLKLAAVLQPQQLSTSEAVVAEQLKVAEKQQQVELQKQQVTLDAEQEQVFEKRDVVDVAKWARSKKDKPFLQRYEESRRFYHTCLTEGPITKKRMEEIDARVAAEVQRTVSGLMNPGVEQKQAKPGPEAPNTVNPGAATKAGGAEDTAAHTARG